MRRWRVNPVKFAPQLFNRVNLIFILIILFGAAIISRLIYLQIVQHDLYRALAQGQQKDFQLLKGERGKIFFKDGQILATNVREKYLFVSPAEIQEKEKTAKTLSQILNLKEDLILEKVKKDSFFEKIKSNLTREEEEALLEINPVRNFVSNGVNLTGVYMGEGVFRKYPQEFMASQVIGFFGGQEQGQYGIEGYYDEILQGKEKLLERENSASDNFVKSTDIFLTLDYNLQFITEKLLEKAKENLDIEGGQIIVLDPNSGKIFALANFPNFNPNNYSEVEDFQIFQNGAIQKLFEPGSTFKPITMAGALQEEKITPDTTFVDQGFVKIGKDIIYNYDKISWGEQTMTQVLENSINSGAVFSEKKLGHNLFLKYLEKFGIFEPTNIDLQGEIFSENKEFKKGYEINFATASFGQGIEMTPLQLVRALSVIANGGKLIKPYIVEKMIIDGKEIITQPEVLDSQVISKKTASQLSAMLVSSVEQGYAKRAKIPGYYIAGKTGTSQIPFSSLGINKLGYSDKTWQTFIGWLPAFEPKFLILVKLDNPKAAVAGLSTTLIAKDLMKYLIDYYQIPPDYEPR